MGTFAQHLYDELDRQIALVEGHMTEGGCKDYANYAWSAGQIEALKQAKGIVAESISTYTNEEDEDGT